MKSVLSVFDEYDIDVSISGPNEIELAGLSKLDPDSYRHVLSYAREKKPEIIRELISGRPEQVEPGNCEACPACGPWDYSHYAGKLWCFHYAIFLAKSGRPTLCDIARENCPLSDKAERRGQSK